MMISDRNSALAWLQSWGGKPRAGILREALRGLRIARAIASARVYSDQTRADYDAAIKALEIES